MRAPDTTDDIAPSQSPQEESRDETSGIPLSCDRSNIDLLRKLHGRYSAPAERGKRFKQEPMDLPCCRTCYGMLQSCLNPPYPPGSRVHVFQVVIAELERLAKFCSVCHLLLKTLGGPNGHILAQMKAYSDDSFNPFDGYHSDGVSDIDAMMNDGRKVTVSLDALPNVSTSGPITCTGLDLRFTITFRTQVRQVREMTSNMQMKLSVFKASGMSSHLQPYKNAYY